jgi:hypothetical protein
MFHFEFEQQAPHFLNNLCMHISHYSDTIIYALAYDQQQDRI